jgi:hypothetical protein
MTKKLSVIIQIVLVFAALAGSVYVACTPAGSLIKWFNSDDAFFYYKVAVNFISGKGFTFDGINLSNGFHPLWMMVCLSVFWLAKFDLVLPLRVLIIVSGLFNAATALVIYHLLIKRVHPAAAVVSSFLWALVPSIYAIVAEQGMESGISAFFIALLAYKASTLLDSGTGITKKQMAEAGFIGVLTILARLDNVFIVAMIGFFLMFRITRITRRLIFDVVTIGIAMILSWIIRFGLEGFRTNSYSIYPMLGVAILVKPIVYYFCGMYQGFGAKKFFRRLGLQLLAALTSFLLMYALMGGLNHFGVFNMFSRSVLAIDAAVCAGLIFILRMFQKAEPPAVHSPLGQVKDWLKANWKEAFLNGCMFALPIALLMGIYISFNKVIFGSFAPVSGQIKVWWSTLPNTVYAQPGSLLTMLGLDPSGADGPWSLITMRINDVAVALMKLTGHETSALHSTLFLILFLLFLLAVLYALNLKSAQAGRKAFTLVLPALVLGSLFQIAYYNTVGYQGIRLWYWVAQMLVIVLLLSILLDLFFNWLDRYKPARLWSGLLAVLIIALIAVRHVNHIRLTYPFSIPEANREAFLSETREVESFTEPGTKIGMTGGGLVGYFIQDRTVVNLDGLINSLEYFTAMKSGGAQAFLDALPLDYVYGNPYMLKESDPYKDILGGRLIEIGLIRGYDDFILYRYEPNQ